MLKKVIDIISDSLSIKPSRITPEATMTDLDIDRHDLLSVVTDLEDEYDIIIDYSRLDGFQTVGDLDTYVESKI